MALQLRPHQAWAALVFVSVLRVHAAPEVDPSRNAVDPCKAEVSRFEQAIGFVRQNQGTAAASALKEKLLPAQVEAELLMKEGYCGLARWLREHKLAR